MPPDPAVLLQRAGDLQRSGRPGEAVALYRTVLRGNARLPQVHNNLAAALNAAGRSQEAVASYRRALKLQPDYAIAHRNLAGLLRRLGRATAALEHAEKAHRFAPDDDMSVVMLAQTIAEMRFAKPSALARRVLLALFQRNDVDLQGLVEAGLRLLLADRRIGAAATAALEGELRGRPPGPLLSDLPPDDLLIQMLCWTILPSPAIECWITLTRRVLLGQAVSGAPITAAIDVLAALALQCGQTEFCYAVTEAESRGLETLCNRLGCIDAVRADWLVAAMYQQPERTAFAPHLIATAAGPAGRLPVDLLLRRILHDDARETELAATIPAIGAVREATSMRVRAQYEANPYPRWRSADLLQHRSLRTHLGERFAGFRAGAANLEAPAILVAGCGTGRQAAITARRYAGAGVTALDLSLRSLAYGARMASELGVSNLAFVHGDLADVRALQHTFDAIECSGVLHHLADPLAGWQALRAVLKPGGVMRIALYSRRARAGFAALRENVDGLDAAALAGRIRAGRCRLHEFSENDAARVLLRTADGYSMSGYRDMLMHTQEIGFSLTEIAAALAQLELRFLGFDWVADAALEGYHARFPGDADAVDLDAWDAFEQDRPDTFITMYQFWCQTA